MVSKQIAINYSDQKNGFTFYIASLGKYFSFFLALGVRSSASKFSASCGDWSASQYHSMYNTFGYPIGSIGNPLAKLFIQRDFEVS
jgi:hypothetical protein